MKAPEISTLSMVNHNLGRFKIQLPASSFVTEQTQMLDGIKLSFEDAVPGRSLKDILSRREAELSKDGRKPFIARYEWTANTGAVLFVPHFSDRTYYEIEARRLLPQRTLIADTDGDRTKVELMQTIVRRVLENYAPDDHDSPSFDRFGLVYGSLHQRFGVAEEVHAEFTLPDTGTRLEFDSAVIARPVQMDLFEREAGAVAEAKESGLVMDVLRKKHRTVAAQDGVELVDTGVSRQQRQYAAYFETPGVPNSPSQTHLVIRFYTEDILPSAPNEKQFLALWDSILDSLKVAP